MHTQAQSQEALGASAVDCRSQGFLAVSGKDPERVRAELVQWPQERELHQHAETMLVQG